VWVKEIITPDVLNNKLILAKVDREYTVWQLAALMGSSQVLYKLSEWVTEKLN
jgi:hypothetical protein